MPRTCKGPRLIAYVLFRSYAIVTTFVGLHLDLGPVKVLGQGPVKVLGLGPAEVLDRRCLGPAKVLGELAMVGKRVGA